MPMRKPKAGSCSKATKDFLSGRFSIPTSLLVSSARVPDKFGGAGSRPGPAEAVPEKVELETESCPHLDKSIRSIPKLYHIHRKVEKKVQARYRLKTNGKPLIKAAISLLNDGKSFIEAASILNNYGHVKRQAKSCPFRMDCSICVCLDCDFTCCLRCAGGDIKIHSSHTGHLLGYCKLRSTGSRTALSCFKCDELIELIEFKTEKVILPIHCFSKDGRDAVLKYLPVKFLKTLFSRKILPLPPTNCRGLVNFGKTCYINCIMQVLVHLPMVNRFFFEKREDLNLTCQQRQGTDKLSLLTVFNSLLQEFQSRDSAPIYQSACVLLTLVWEKMPVVGYNKQHDAHELLISVINLLHQELLQLKDSKNGPIESLVDKLFLGRLQSEVTCTVCDHSRYTDDPFWDASLEVVSDGPLGSPINVNDLLTRYTRIEQLDEFNLLHCTCCSKKTKSTKQLKFKMLPSVFCLQLKRFQHNPRYSGSNCFTKIKTVVHIPEKIDFSPFRCSARRSEPKKPRLDPPNISTAAGEANQDWWYHLYAIVNHSGSYASGHYRTYIRKACSWYICDDTIMKQVSKEEALKSEGYLLFYEKISASDRNRALIPDSQGFHFK